MTRRTDGGGRAWGRARSSSPRPETDRVFVCFLPRLRVLPINRSARTTFRRRFAGVRVRTERYRMRSCVWTHESDERTAKHACVRSFTFDVTRPKLHVDRRRCGRVLGGGGEACFSSVHVRSTAGRGFRPDSKWTVWFLPKTKMTFVANDENVLEITRF